MIPGFLFPAKHLCHGTVSWFWFFGCVKATGCVTMFVEVICSNALLNAFAQSSEWFKALIHLQYMRSTGETTVTWLLNLSRCFFWDVGWSQRPLEGDSYCTQNARASILCHLILLKRLETMLNAQEKIIVEHRQTAPKKDTCDNQSLRRKSYENATLASSWMQCLVGWESCFLGDDIISRISQALQQNWAPKSTSSCALNTQSFHVILPFLSESKKITKKIAKLIRVVPSNPTVLFQPAGTSRCFTPVEVISFNTVLHALRHLWFQSILLLSEMEDFTVRHKRREGGYGWGDVLWKEMHVVYLFINIFNIYRYLQYIHMILTYR